MRENNAAQASIGRGQRFARRLGAALTVVALLPGAMPVADLHVDIQKLRSAKGMIRVCLTADPKNFPGCVDDSRAVTRSVRADAPNIVFQALPQGDYAVAVIHDENGNKKLDTFAGIPREGFGFSRNPAIGFGPPKFAAARFSLTSDATEQPIRMKYLL
ncbi:MAG: DUF2141 domain-containing protein [Pseudomonadota bacterium]|uniref:DUF2141 domain-containing protein n=1 Tax=Sphingomonas sp. ERG5 TaxID=1381597 RepID=UPI002E0D5C15